MLSAMLDCPPLDKILTLIEALAIIKCTTHVHILVINIADNKLPNLSVKIEI